MDSDRQEILKALLQAIDFEKDGLKTYLDYARMTEDATGKDMFILLARDEYDHMTILENMMSEVREKGEWPQLEMDRESPFKKILPRIKDAGTLSRGSEGINQMHAIDIALEFEGRARDLYKELAEKCGNKYAESIFLNLVEIEQAHYDILEAQKGSISDSGLWLEIAGMGMESL